MLFFLLAAVQLALLGLEWPYMTAQNLKTERKTAVVLTVLNIAIGAGILLQGSAGNPVRWLDALLGPLGRWLSGSGS